MLNAGSRLLCAYFALFQAFMWKAEQQHVEWNLSHMIIKDVTTAES